MRELLDPPQELASYTADRVSFAIKSCESMSLAFRLGLNVLLRISLVTLPWLSAHRFYTSQLKILEVVLSKK